MLACNVVEEGDAVLTERVSKSTVVEVAGGKRVGIIGYVLQDTEWISSPGPTIRIVFHEFPMVFCKVIRGVGFFVQFL